MTARTCPYNFDNLCKHEVAALYYINNFLIDNVNKTHLSPETIKKFNQGELKLNNHLLDEDLIIRLRNIQDIYFSHNDVSLKRIIKNGIECVTYNNKLIVFQYNSATRVLYFTADKIEYFYDLVLLALLRIITYLGKDFFSPKYKQNMLDNYIQKNGLNKKYTSVLDIDLVNGHVKVISKIKDLYFNNENFQKRLTLDEEECTILNLPLEKAHNNEDRGLGFCIELRCHEKIKFEFILFQGKFKKNTREISSSLKWIHNGNILDYLNFYEEEKHILTDFLTLADKLEDIFFLEKYFDILSVAYVKFKKFVQNNKNDYPFFIKPESQTLLARKNIKPIVISDIPANLFFTTKKTKQCISIIPKIRISDEEFNIDDEQIYITAFFCIKNGMSIHFFESAKDFVYLSKLDFSATINVPDFDKDAAFHNIIHPLSKHFKVEHNLIKLKSLPSSCSRHKEIYISEFKKQYVVFRLGVKYADSLVMTESNEDVFDSKLQQWIQRDRLFEEEFIDYFQGLHPDFEHQQGVFYLEPYKLIEDEWLIKTSQKLQQHNIELFGVKDLKTFNYNLHKPSISMSIASGVDWFDIKVNVTFGREQVTLKAIKQAVLNKQKFVHLKDGSLGVLPQAWLKKIAKYFKIGKVGIKEIQVSQYQFSLLDDLYDQLEKKPKFLQELYRKKQALENIQNQKVENITIPQGLKAQLRPYQQQGLNWLVFLYNNNLGGCLADDMGLGKTLQAIALLAYIKNGNNNKLLPHLIVAPTSLIFNWSKELEKFAPRLKVFIYTGSSRSENREQIEEADVVITSYGIVVNDCDFLQQQTFNYVIADESQAIKNPNSKRYKAMRLLKADNRLALTGTPIENNTFDLYAQMNFINPGMLGSINHFRSEFSNAIDKEKDTEVASLLHKMVYPFLLRRTKSQVAQDLPAKTEHIIFCEMEQEQRQVYDSIKEEYRQGLLKKIQQEGEEKAQLYVLQGLTKLRQICNAPQLLDDEGSYTKESIKLDILLDYVLKIIAQGSKILIFSQFTSMLSLVKERLDTEGILFEYLDGRTTNRQE